ncbi:hypothetical protein M0805_005168 [Coniferiporia weirii]|nr:hypothetical protein M0805_005168 [Coniferiporia weirii]
MDRIEALGSALSQVSMYDIKSMYNQAKNMVLNVSEMEAKVREATNDDPWGASSTLMQEIAQGTFNLQQFNEVMPCIYSRFMDKEARQWREIYKSLQLLEYVIKHGSERVVDDARSHISTIKMLRNFHYIDDKGKDQGINVRNRAKEVAELLSDVERIRNERRKAKSNRNKYIGTGNDGMSFSGGSGGRYGGFGSEGFGSGSGSGSRGGGYENDYGGYGGGGSSSGGFRDDTSRRGFDEYNAGDDEVSAPRRSNSLASGSGGTSARMSAVSSPAPAPPPVKAPAKVVDLIGLEDEDPFSAPVAAPAPVSVGKAAEKALPALAQNPLDDGGDDDFADFQAAPPSATIPQTQGNMFDALQAAPQVGFTQPPAQRFVQPVQPMQPVQPVRGGYTQSPFVAMSPTVAARSPPPSASVFGGVMSPTSPPPMGMTRPTPTTATSSSSTARAKPASPSVGFDDLWTMSLGTGAKSATGAGGSGAGAGAGKSMKDLEKEKAQASIWGGQAAKSQGVFGAVSNAGGSDDLLL